MKVEVKEVVETIPKKRTTKTYICEVCGKKYRSKYDCEICESECKVRVCQHNYVKEIIETNHTGEYGPDYGECICIEKYKITCRLCGDKEIIPTPEGFEDKMKEYAQKLLEE